VWEEKGIKIKRKEGKMPTNKVLVILEKRFIFGHTHTQHTLRTHTFEFLLHTYVSTQGQK